jgi:hypothetical protein
MSKVRPRGVFRNVLRGGEHEEKVQICVHEAYSCKISHIIKINIKYGEWEGTGPMCLSLKYAPGHRPVVGPEIFK